MKNTDYYNAMTEAEQIEAVKNVGSAVRFIDNPSETVQLAAIEAVSFTIRYIDNPTVRVQVEAVRRSGSHVLRHIKNPSFRAIYEAYRRSKGGKWSYFEEDLSGAVKMMIEEKYRREQLF